MKSGRSRLILLIVFLGAAGLTELSRARADPICIPGDDDGGPDSETKIEKLADVTKSLAGYKTDEGVARYVTCYNDSKFQSVYVNTYMRYLKTASKVIDVPNSILTCLFFRESVGWNKDAVSSVGAVGLAQLMPTTFTRMAGYVRNPVDRLKPEIAKVLRREIRKDGKNAAEIEETLQSIEKILARQAAGKSIIDVDTLTKFREALMTFRTLNDSAPGDDVDHYIATTQERIDHGTIRKMWNEYTAALGKPASISPNDPKAAIFLGAAYLKVIVFGGYFEKDHRYRYPSHDRWVIATGAYNAGIGGLKCGIEMTADACIALTLKREDEFAEKRHRKAIHETSNHMTSIRNCSEQGNPNPMPPDHMRGCKI